METPARREAEFIGRVTASATHEIRNVLAIVKESAGLIEDLVRASGPGGVPPAERLLKATGRIDAQVARGAEIVTRLNRFAHSMDDGERRVDLVEEIREAAFLSQRRARQRRQSVESAPGAAPVWVTADALRVQMALHSVVEFCLDQLPDGARLQVRAGDAGGSPATDLMSAESSGAGLPSTAEAPGWRELGERLARDGIDLRSLEGRWGVRLRWGMKG